MELLALVGAIALCAAGAYLVDFWWKDIGQSYRKAAEEVAGAAGFILWSLGWLAWAVVLIANGRSWLPRWTPEWAASLLGGAAWLALPLVLVWFVLVGLPALKRFLAAHTAPVLIAVAGIVLLLALAPLALPPA